MMVLGAVLIVASLEPGSPRPFTKLGESLGSIGESLEDFDHMLDMVGQGLNCLTTPQNIKCKKKKREVLTDLCPP